MQRKKIPRVMNLTCSHMCSGSGSERDFQLRWRILNELSREIAPWIVTTPQIRPHKAVPKPTKA